MIRHRNEMKAETVERRRGGEGTIDYLHFFDEKEMSHARLFAEMTLPPGSSIGEHVHSVDTEYIVVLKGTGTLLENGEPRPLGPGDVSQTGNGSSHSLMNTGQVPLVVIAVVITE